MWIACSCRKLFSDPAVNIRGLRLRRAAGFPPRARLRGGRGRPTRAATVSRVGGKVERAVESSVIAAPLVGARPADVPARPANSPETPVAEAPGARAETPVEPEDGAGGVEAGGEAGGETDGKARHASRAFAGATRKVRYRAGNGRSATVRRAGAVRPNSGTAYNRGGKVRQTTEGAKKSGSWLGRKLKKVGDIFHE